jgi:hypothetical protein
MHYKNFDHTLERL